MKLSNACFTVSSALSSALLLASCAAAPKPLPPPEVTPPPAPMPVAKVEAPDLSPAPPPQNLLVRATWKNPAESLKTLEAVIGRPLQPFVQEAIGDAEVMDLMALEGAIHGVVVLDPKATFERDRDRPPGMSGAFSLPLRDFARARSYAEQHGAVEAVRPGVVRIRPGKGEKPACTLAVAVGVAPARLVCGDSDAEVDVLLPWLTRGAPLDTTQTSDMTIVASGPVLTAAMDAHLPAIFASLQRSRSTEAQAQRWMDDAIAFIRDTKLMDATLTLDRKEMRLAFGFEVTSSKSRFTTFGLSGKSTGLPPELGRVPSGATVVAFSSGLDASLGRAFMKEIIEVEDARAYRPATPAAHEKRVALAEQAPFFAPFFYVRGESDAGTMRRGESHAEERMRQSRAALGWSLGLVDVAPAEMSTFLAGVVTELQRQRQAYKQSPNGIRYAAAPPGFPAGSKEVVVESEYYDYSTTTGKPLKSKRQKVHFVFVPAGSRTLLALGADTKELAARAKTFLDPATKEAGNTERDALLKADFVGASAGMALMPSAIAQSISAAFGTSSPLRGTPHGGKTPVPFVLRREKDGSRLVAEVRLHEKAVIDAGAVARFGLDMFSMVTQQDKGRSSGLFIPEEAPVPMPPPTTVPTIQP